jgi:excisionase family DNA binding protein
MSSESTSTAEPQDDLDLVDYRGAARMLQSSPRLVQRRVAAGELESIRLGHRTVRIERREVLRYLNEHRRAVR